MAKKLKLNEIIVKLKDINPNITIIEDKYINSKTPIKCKCNICNHEWSAKWNNLSSNNSGCPNCYELNRRISKEEMIKEAEINGYKILEFVEIGNTIRNTRVILECPEGHPYEIYLGSFQSGKRCRKCTNKKLAQNRKNDSLAVKEEIESYGYTIEGNFNYENSKSPFTITCKERHERTLAYNRFCKSKECPECKLGRKVKYGEDDVIIILSKLGLKYVKGFVNTHTAFTYICSCGEEALGRLYDIRTGHRCSKCSGNKVYTLQEIQNTYSECGCELLEEDVTNFSQRKLKFKCTCGNEGCKLYYDFLDNPYCRDCGIKRRTGENHQNYNPELTNDERITKRKYNEYEVWRQLVFERDNYTCQCCGDDKGGNLHAHHLDGYNWCVERRTNTSNGITLCENCHTEFHLENGYGGNTEEQFNNWLNSKNK